MHFLNLGIVAHVDAGKTSLTERLLFAAGVIDTPGSVDAGTTRTDSMALERQRGITIRSSVTSFGVDHVTVNLIDTPGHSDFVAEVDRALSVLDAAALVLSAVEGVQPQTVVLWRALQRLRIPTVVFINKIDRAGADPIAVMTSLDHRLAGRDGVDLSNVADQDIVDEATQQAIADRRIVPVLCGSAITGAGVPELMRMLPSLAPTNDEVTGDAAYGTVFKIDRDAAGVRQVYVRLRRGTLSVRQRVYAAAGTAERITGMRVTSSGGMERADRAVAGQIALVQGLSRARIGDAVRSQSSGATNSVDAEGDQLAAPMLEAVVRPVDAQRRPAMFAALKELAAQDSLIDLHVDDESGEAAVRLCGAVQQEVVAATLAQEYDVPVVFDALTTVCIERVSGVGSAVDRIREGDNPYLATIGLRVEPAPPGAGVRFALEVELGSMPPAFFTATEEAVRSSLRHGLHGWDVPDCVVTMTDSGYWARQGHAHQKFNKAFSSVGADFRGLAPVVLMAALRQARTQVCEPVDRVDLEVPQDSLPAVLSLLGRCGAVVRSTGQDHEYTVIAADLAARSVSQVSSRLADITRGEGVMTHRPDHFSPIADHRPPQRRRGGPDPSDRVRWFREVAR